MQDTCLVLTVIVVVRNDIAGLRKTLLSLAACISTRFEVVIKDGLSSDGSSDIPLPDKRFRIYSSSDNGIYDAMNQAVVHARALYLFFMNCGDVVLDCLAFCGFIDDLGAHPKVGHVVFYNNVFVQREGGFVVVKSPRLLSRFYLYRQVVCHQALYMPTELFRLHGGFDCSNFLIRADQELSLRVHKRHVVFVHRNSSFIACAPFGFSLARSRVQRSADELRSIRRLYFSRFELLAFAIFHCLTLPSLRKWLLKNFPADLASVYRKFFF